LFYDSGGGRFKGAPLASVILISWVIAFFEYCFQVPANRFGHGMFTAAQLKTIQEIITLGGICSFFHPLLKGKIYLELFYRFFLNYSRVIFYF